MLLTISWEIELETIEPSSKIEFKETDAAILNV